MTISSIQVKRRPFVSQNGWTKPEAPITVAQVEKPTLPDTEIKASRIPSLMELVYAIYDTQHDIISNLTPKRFKCKIPLPVKQIERWYHHNPALVTFDGMSHYQATQHFKQRANDIGIRNEFCIPFIFADKINIRSHAFRTGYAFTFETFDGIRYQTLGTQQEFFWLSTNRQILSNLSYHLNLKYNCNLHIASDEADRVYFNTGKVIAHNRHLFTRACDYYTNPQLLSIDWFLRAQVKSLREVTDEVLWNAINNTEDLLTTDPKLAFEVDKAKSIYNGKIKQWVGDFSHEVPAQ